MNLNPRIKKIADRLLKFLQLQLFITLISFPILVSWGLPISLLSPIGNLIFAPVLSLFLLLSSLMFFTSLLYIPNGLLCFLLEKVTTWWIAIMANANNSWLFGFAKPSWFVLIIIPILALVLLHIRFIRSHLISTLCFLALFILCCGYIYLTHSNNRTYMESIACNRGSITLIHHNNTVTIIDPGVIGQSIAAPTWVEYTLMPAITKITGRTTIDHLILMQPGSMLFQAIATLAQKMIIKNTYLTCWQGTVSKYEWANFFKLKEALNNNHCMFKRIGTKPIPIAISSNDQLIITPTEHLITTKQIKYPAVTVAGSFGTHTCCVTSYKKEMSDKKKNA